MRLQGSSMNLIKNENILFGILLLIFMTIIIPNKLRGIDLNQYLWKNRIIITFAKDEDHPDLMRLKAEMKENKCEILNRDLLHLNFNNYHEIKNLTTINDKSFRILLIGKDGGVKYESNRFISLMQLFVLIDSMQMRQREMQHDQC